MFLLTQKEVWDSPHFRLWYQIVSTEQVWSALVLLQRYDNIVSSHSAEDTVVLNLRRNTDPALCVRGKMVNKFDVERALN
jgi:hypothetical protein